MALSPNLDVLSPKAKEALDPATPEELRRAAASLPTEEIPLRDRLALLVAFANGVDLHLADWAASKFKQLSPATLAVALTTEQDAAVVHALAQTHLADGLAASLLLRTPTIAQETLYLMASLGGEAICEQLASNETRLLENPQLVARLYMNTGTRMSTADWLLSFAEAHDIDVDLGAGASQVELDRPWRTHERPRPRPVAAPRAAPSTTHVPRRPSAPKPPATRINLLQPQASLLVPLGRALLSMVAARLAKPAKQPDQRASPSAHNPVRFEADPFSTDYVKKLRQEIAELRETVARKNATIAAMTEERLLAKGKRLLGG